jgi:formate dehydrogenase iron-sulfur subunit
MPISRRDFLKMAGVGAGAVATVVVPEPVEAAPLQADESASMLYDASLCVGCRACQTACKERSNLPAVTDPQQLYEQPTDLNANNWTIIQLYQGDQGQSFVKRNCMHCIDPACVSVCPVAALQKTENGPVVYHKERCIGCRYCMAACPFHIPKSQWTEALPYIQKCDFCSDRLEQGESTACETACPTGAIKFGKRKDMLATAKARLAADPTFVQHVYGETEAAGTSQLYISKVDFASLGLFDVAETDFAKITWPYMKAVPGVIGVMVTLSTAVYLWTHRKKNGNGDNGNHNQPGKEG